MEWQNQGEKHTWGDRQVAEMPHNPSSTVTEIPQPGRVVMIFCMMDAGNVPDSTDWGMCDRPLIFPRLLLHPNRSPRRRNQQQHPRFIQVDGSGRNPNPDHRIGSGSISTSFQFR